MAPQPAGIARIHTEGGTELIPDIVQSLDKPTYTAHLHLNSETIAINVRGLEIFLKPHQTYPTLQFWNEMKTRKVHKSTEELC